MSAEVVIRNRDELAALEAKVATSAKRAVERVRGVLDSADPLMAFAAMKFDPTGFHPTDDRNLNLIEQVNQTFTFLATARATAWLMDRYPNVAGYRLNLGTAAGTDIEALDGTIAAETFATVDPRNNRKLAKDIAKVAKTAAAHKYVFYICPTQAQGEPSTAPSETGVKVVSLGWKR